MTVDEISKIKLEHPEIPGKSLVKQIFFNFIFLLPKRITMEGRRAQIRCEHRGIFPWEAVPQGGPNSVGEHSLVDSVKIRDITWYNLDYTDWCF